MPTGFPEAAVISSGEALAVYILMKMLGGAACARTARVSARVLRARSMCVRTYTNTHAFLLLRV